MEGCFMFQCGGEEVCFSDGGGGASFLSGGGGRGAPHGGIDFGGGVSKKF